MYRSALTSALVFFGGLAALHCIFLGARWSEPALTYAMLVSALVLTVIAAIGRQAWKLGLFTIASAMLGVGSGAVVRGLGLGDGRACLAMTATTLVVISLFGGISIASKAGEPNLFLKKCLTSAAFLSAVSLASVAAVNFLPLVLESAAACIALLVGLLLERRAKSAVKADAPAKP